MPAAGMGAAALRVGLVGAPGQTAIVYGGTGPGSGATAQGLSGLRLPEEIGRFELPAGVACVDISLPAALAGLAWVQVAYVGSSVTGGRPLDAFATGAPAGPHLLVVIGLLVRKRRNEC